MVSVEEVVVLYDVPKQPGDTVDLFKLVKFLNSLKKRVSVRIFSTEEFSNADQPIKFRKAVLFLRDTGKIVATVEDVRKRFDPEEGVAMKIVTSESGKTMLVDSNKLVKADDIVTAAEELHDFHQCYPVLLMFLFGKKKEQTEQNKFALFFLDDDDAVEMTWFNMIRSTINSGGGKHCMRMGDVEGLTTERIDCVVIVSRGDGLAILNYVDAIVQCLQNPNIQCLVVTNNMKSTLVKQLKTHKENSFYKCDDNLALSYKDWTLLLRKMSLIDCKDPNELSQALKTLKIIGIVLAVVIFGAIILAAWVAIIVFTGKIIFPTGRVTPGD